MSLLAVLIAAEGTWSLELYHTWPFIAVLVLPSLFLAGTVLCDIHGKSVSSAASHLGLFLILSSGLAGAPFMTDAQMMITREEPTHLAFTTDGVGIQVPFEVSLAGFTTDYYKDGVSPKQYTGYMKIDGKDFQTSVNHPCRYKGYHIYQSDYDWSEGRYSVIKVVKDPLLPLVYLGMILMVTGALMQIGKAWKSRKVVPAVLAMAVIFTFISLARINLGTLMPALRSLWFVPHLIIYMIAYSVLALAVVTGIISLCRKEPLHLSHKLLVTASSLLLIGMICGAVWAKAAWGQCWTWDAKECWAAVTWLITLAGTHMPGRKRGAALFLAIVLSFAAMQVTWYGVNYLPSSTYSLHSYNTRVR